MLLKDQGSYHDTQRKKKLQAVLLGQTLTGLIRLTNVSGAQVGIPDFVVQLHLLEVGTVIFCSAWLAHGAQVGCSFIDMSCKHQKCNDTENA